MSTARVKRYLTVGIAALFVVFIMFPTFYLMPFLLLSLLVSPNDNLLGHGLVTLPFVLGLALGSLTFRARPSDILLVAGGSLLFVSAALTVSYYGVFWLPAGTLIFAAGLGKLGRRRVLPWLRAAMPQ